MAAKPKKNISAGDRRLFRRLTGLVVVVVVVVVQLLVVVDLLPEGPH